MTPSDEARRVGEELEKLQQIEGLIHRLGRIIGGAVAYGQGSHGSTEVLKIMVDEAFRQFDALCHASNLYERQRNEIAALRETLNRKQDELTTYKGLYDVPRRSGGVLSIAQIVDPSRPEGQTTAVMVRHEKAGSTRHVMVRGEQNPLTLLRREPWQQRRVSPDDAMEVLKTRPEVKWSEWRNQDEGCE